MLRTLCGAAFVTIAVVHSLFNSFARIAFRLQWAYDLAEENLAVAKAEAGRAQSSSLGRHPAPGRRQHGVRRRASGPQMAGDSTQPPHATRFIETTRGVLSYSQLATLLAERVLKVQEDIEDRALAERPLDESLLLEIHRAICGDLTPDWAGRFRDSDVRVGEHHPPLL